DCGFEIAQQDRVTKSRGWKLILDSCLTQMTSLHQPSFNLKSKILKWSLQAIYETFGLGGEFRKELI
ncbi:MAG: hypothetical protein C0610_10220, partial [Desulfobacteraceae bacterium]